jgi:hypothetical protein
MYMTRRTRKGGLLKGAVNYGTIPIGKVLKKGEKVLVTDQATRKAFALTNPKTFMGQNMVVHAYSLKAVAEKVFAFAKKYEKYARTCKKDKGCPTQHQVTDDRTNLITDIKNNLPSFDGNFLIKDPRKGTYSSYAEINKNKRLRKEDILFLYRLGLLLNKLKVVDEDVTKKMDSYSFITGTYTKESGLYGTITYTIVDDKKIKTKALALDEATKRLQNLKNEETKANKLKAHNELIEAQAIARSTFKFDELTQKEKNKEFETRYKEQYEEVTNNTGDSATTAKDVDNTGDSGPSSEVKKYIDGFRGQPFYKGTKYTLKRTDKIISIEPNPPPTV